MRIGYSKLFITQAKKLSPALRLRLQDRIRLFVVNTLDPSLRNHQLKGAYKQYRSIDVTGDVRALYVPVGDELIFDTVGIHSQLYGQIVVDDNGVLDILNYFKLQERVQMVTFLT